jgi:tRNA1Val (adenine37-N6)-methyltransferase
MRDEQTTIDKLARFGLKVAQPTDGYRFSLDALLLADFVDQRAVSRYCDLGTGCGVIPLIICRRFPDASAVAVENNPEMAEMAKINVVINGLEERVQIITDDILNLKSKFPVSSFDSVVSNPPFRTSHGGRVSPIAGRDTARHESSAGISAFLDTAKYLVKPAGRICFVYHPDRLTEFIHCATELKLSLLRLRMVHGTAGVPAKIFLAELAKGRKSVTKVLQPLIVYETTGDYTTEMKTILQGID